MTLLGWVWLVGGLGTLIGALVVYREDVVEKFDRYPVETVFDGVLFLIFGVAFFPLIVAGAVVWAMAHGVVWILRRRTIPRVHDLRNSRRGTKGMLP